MLAIFHLVSKKERKKRIKNCTQACLTFSCVKSLRNLSAKGPQASGASFGFEIEGANFQ